MRPSLLAIVLALLSWVRPGLTPQEAGGPDREGLELFEKKIKPILVGRCYKCHSAQAEKLKGDLHLDTREGMLKGGAIGPAVVPGDPEKSLLIKAIRWTDEDLKMPPKERLTPEQVAEFEAWIRRGAVIPGASGPPVGTESVDLAAGRRWWAFRPPKEHPVPPVKLSDWPKNSIDSFILAKLEEMGQRPAPPADKRTLLRRATYDLIGLPPKPEEIDAFLADDSPEAFAKVVDRLLASPHYGERWGRHWLDVARYTDSFDSRGLGGPSDIPEAYRYRDWVVDAFNRDLPYDQFILRQIAGDLLAPSGFDAEAIVATGLFVIGEWGTGDADKEKLLTDIVDDQIDVVGRGFLGVTLACARCHDHKFDPISTEDYYGLAGIFFSSHILPSPGAKTASSPVLRIPLAPAADVERRKRHEAAIAELEKRIDTASDAEYAALARGLLAQSGCLLAAAGEYSSLRPKPALSDFAARKRLPEFALAAWVNYLGTGDLGLLASPARDFSGQRGLLAWKNPAGGETPFALANSGDQPRAFGTIKLPPRCVAVHPSPSAGVAVAWRSPIAGAVAIRGRVVDADSVCGDGIDWTLSHLPGHGTVELARGEIPNGGAQDVPVRTVEVKIGDLVQLVIGPKKEYTCDTTVVELEIAEQAGEKRVWDLTRECAPDLHQGNPHPDAFGNAGVWCFIDMARRARGSQLAPESALARWSGAKDKEKAAAEVQEALLAADAEYAELLKKAPAGKPFDPAQGREPPRLKGPNARLYHDVTDPKGPFWTPARRDGRILPEEARERISKMRQELAALKQTLPPPIPVAHGLQEGGTPQSAHAGIHDVAVHIRGRYDRLGAVVPRRFPLVLAGEERPPIAQGSGRLELARWIASPENPLTARVMANRIWQHHFGEGIVRTPNNYGKLGRAPTHPELLDFLALRFVRSGWSIKAMHRLIMLSAAYRQSSVPLPETLKADPANELFGRMNRRRLEAEPLRDGMLAVADLLDRTMKGPASRELTTPRRTLYLMTVRSDRSNYRLLFDAADPCAIVERRIDSTVAPQALFLLNNPYVLSIAKALAQRVIRQGPAEDTARISWLYALLYGRPPVEQEVRIGLAMLARARGAENAAGAGAAPEPLWEPYCQALLCANEFIYVD